MVGREEARDLAAKVAEVGAALCCYAPGHGNPERWPTSKCDCKYGATGQGEQTGCPEARALYRMLTPGARLGVSEHLTAVSPMDLRVPCEDCGMEVPLSRTVTVDHGVTCDVCWFDGSGAMEIPVSDPPHWQIVYSTEEATWSQGFIGLYVDASMHAQAESRRFGARYYISELWPLCKHCEGTGSLTDGITDCPRCKGRAATRKGRR